MPVDLSGVELKETAFQCQAFDTSSFALYEIVMVDHLRKKTLLGWPQIQFTSLWTISIQSLFSCTLFAFDSSISIRLKSTSFDLLLPTMWLTFRSQVICLLLILIIIAQFSIIFILISFTHTVFNFNFHITSSHHCLLKLVEILLLSLKFAIF